MPYRINLHAHTFFSDGYSSPLSMAVMAESLGFSCLCLTDHYTPNKDEYFKKHSHSCAIKEASNILPVILGMEVYVEGQEILCFGGQLLHEIRKHHGPITLDDIKKWRDSYYCATILCHPSMFYRDHISIIDGYERYNSGQDFFGNREPAGLEHLPAWSNSDAHITGGLSKGWNETEKKITDEHDLIKYIKKQKQPKLFVDMVEVPKDTGGANE